MRWDICFTFKSHSPVISATPITVDDISKRVCAPSVFKTEVTLAPAFEKDGAHTPEISPVCYIDKNLKSFKALIYLSMGKLGMKAKD